MKVLRLLFYILSACLLVQVIAYSDGMQRGSGFSEADLDMQKFSVQSHEVDTTPPTPPTDEIKLYACDDAGTTKYCTVDSLGAVTVVGSGSGGGDNVTVNTTAADTTANIKDTATVTWALVDGGAGGPDDMQATVENDSHTHTSTSISSIDISADTNLTAGANLTITDDDIALDDLVSITTSISSPAFISNNIDPADSGILRLGNAETIAWEASPTGTDATITLNSAEKFVFSNVILSPTFETPILGVATASSVTGNITIASNPALDANSASPADGGIIFEGASNTIEGLLSWLPTTSDKTISLPDENGTICTTGSVCSGYELAGDYIAAAGDTMTGDLVLSENTSIAFDPAGSADGKYSGITVTGTGGATIAFGDLVTLDKDDSRWELVDISVAAAATGDARGILGIAVTSSSDGAAITVLLKGIIRADANFPVLTIGASVYASTTGDCVVTQSTTTDHVIRIVGFALTVDEIYFNPSNDYMTHI